MDRRSPSFTRLAAAGLLAASLAPWHSSGAQTSPPTLYAGSANGTALHADALQSAATRLVDVEVATSAASAAFATGGTHPRTVNEMQRVVQPELTSQQSYARGSGLEAGVGITVPGGDNQAVLAAKAEAKAPGPLQSQTSEIGFAQDPLAYASLVRGRAEARMETTNACGLLGADLAAGLGHVADVQLLDQAPSADDSQGPRLEQPVVALDHPDSERAVTQSRSRTLLVPQLASNGTTVLGDNFGILSETRQTFAPITLFRGTSNQVTIELLGEWALQVLATGLPGSAWVHYGPRDVTPETPILRTLNAAGAVTNVLTFQQVFGAQGHTAVDVPGVVQIAIGEDPRAIGGSASSAPAIAADGTSVAAAVDVLRVKLLEQKDASGAVTARAADVRVGHMEVRAEVMPGGLPCPVPVSKTAEPQSVTVGEEFTVLIDVSNPFECPLESVAVTDSITTKDDARFTVVSTDPVATTVPPGTANQTGSVSWASAGGVPPNGAIRLRVRMRADGGAGEILDVVDVSATLKCPPGSGFGSAKVAGRTSGSAAVGGEGEPLVVPVAQASPTPTVPATPTPTPTPTVSPSPTPTASVLGAVIGRPRTLPVTGGGPGSIRLALMLLGAGLLLSTVGEGASRVASRRADLDTAETWEWPPR